MNEMKNILIMPTVLVDGVIRAGDDDLYFDPILQTAYYNYYYSYGQHFRPTKVFEVGVRAGYTAHYLLSGAAGSVKKYRGIDLESYLQGSNSSATELLSKLCADVRVHGGNSHELKTLDDEYDLIHIDGDHTFDGKVMDLELALGSLAPAGVIVVDDCSPHGPKEPIYRAVQAVVKRHRLRLKTFHPLCGSPQNPVNGHALLMRSP